MIEHRAGRSVRLEGGIVYVLAVTHNNELRDPWCFTQYLDARVKLEEIKIAGETEPDSEIQAAIFRVRVIDQGIEPTRTPSPDA